MGITGLLIGLGVFALIGLMAYVNLRDDQGKDPLADRLAIYGENDVQVQSLEDVEQKLAFRDRVLVPTVRALSGFVARFTPQKQLEMTRHKLELAGQTTEPTAFFLQRIVFTVIFGIVSIPFCSSILNLQFPTLILGIAAGVALGYYFPMLSLNSKISKRQHNIVKALPDALDLLVICVEAGLGFDAAMGKVYEKWDNELALAFGRVLREIQLGKPRREALRDMANRMDVPDVNSFTAAIIQAEQLGVSMSKILRVQSDQMRVKRRQRAQEKAQQAPVKMMIPMVLLIFPSIWIVLLGPAIIKVMNTNTGGAF
jgi:tight adherence protein C